jgi:ammonium transporter, Amt family
MTRIVNNRHMASVAFALLMLICGIAAIYPTSFPTNTSGTAFNTGDMAWMLIATSLVLLMTPGLAFFYGGMVTQKNIISTMLQSFICLGVVSLLWYVVGFSLAFGDDWGGLGLVGNPKTYFMFNNVGTAAHKTIAPGLPFVLFAAFQLKFAVITPALVTGSFAERVRFWGYIVFVNLFCLLIYCPLAHMAWHPDGFLAKWEVLDFAGGTVVHIAAGCAALAGSMVLGKRKVVEDGASTSPVNIPFVILGTGLLWFGWFGFNAGSALGANELAVKAFVNTNLASAVAAVAWIMVDVMRGKKPSALGACIGAVVGLVAITPAAGYVNYGPSLFIGFIAAVTSNQVVVWFHKSGLDDTLDVFPCHGVGGIVGMLLTGVFSTETGSKLGLMYGGTHLITMHILALIIVFAFTFIGSYLLFKLTDLITPLRVDEGEEMEGLDISQHNETILLDTVPAVE